MYIYFDGVTNKFLKQFPLQFHYYHFLLSGERRKLCNAAIVKDQLQKGAKKYELLNLSSTPQLFIEVKVDSGAGIDVGH